MCITHKSTMEEQQEGQAQNYLKLIRDPVTHRFHTMTAQDFVECWKNYDQNNSGYLEGSELNQFLRHFVSSALPDNVSDSVIDEITFKHIKADFVGAFNEKGDGKIDIHDLANILPLDQCFIALIQYDIPLPNSVEFMRIWKTYANEKNYLEPTELESFVKDLMIKADCPESEEKLKEYTKEILTLFDRHHTGRIELTEMARILPVKENYLVKPLFTGSRDICQQELNRIFRKYDIDKDGKLRNEELLGFLKDLTEAINADISMDELIRTKQIILEEWSVNHNDCLDADELSALLHTTIWATQEKAVIEHALSSSCDNVQP